MYGPLFAIRVHPCHFFKNLYPMSTVDKIKEIEAEVQRTFGEFQ